MEVNIYDIDGDRMIVLYRMALADMEWSNVLKEFKSDNEKAYYLEVKKEIDELKAEAKQSGRVVDFYIPD